MTIKNWDTRTIRAEIVASLERNGERAGAFVTQDAKRRLLAIHEPEWGARYRRQVVANLLDYEVEQTANAVEIAIGVKTSAAGRHHGFYIEMGSHTHGPQPFLRPAVFENGSMIVKLLESG